MKKIIAIIVGCLFAGTIEAQVWRNIKITGVIDGDTLRAELVEAPQPLNHVSIRISGIDTPEIKGSCKEEKEKAQEAKNFLTKKFSETRVILFGTLDWDKYGGRILAEVYFDGQDVSQIMIKSGYAVPYKGKRKTNIWCNY